MARKSRGFMQTGGLLKTRIRSASESRGFAETRLLTHWEDIAGPAMFLASDQAAFITGQTIIVDGGYSIG